MTQYIDLSHPIEEGMITFNAPWHPTVLIEQMGRIDEVGRESRKISFGSHTGTHIDAPLHFFKEGKSIDSIPLDRLIGKVILVDFSHLKENEQVTKAMLEPFEIGEKAIFLFGRGKFWGEKKFYEDYPFFSMEAAEYLVSRGVKLIGYDTPSPDDSHIELSGENLGSDRDSPIHKLFLKNDIVLLEYVANLEKVEDLNGWSIIALPLRIKGCDGSPARVCIYK